MLRKLAIALAYEYYMGRFEYRSKEEKAEKIAKQNAEREWWRWKEPAKKILNDLGLNHEQESEG